MARRRQYKPKQVADALTLNKGMVYLAARTLGCKHTTVYNYINDYDICREAYEQQGGEVVDHAELKLFEAVERCEPWAVNKVLNEKGRNRGYGVESGLQPQAVFEFIGQILAYVDAAKQEELRAILQRQLGPDVPAPLRLTHGT